MDTLNEERVPQDLDEAFRWILRATSDPAMRERILSSRQSTATFIAQAASILGAIARRDDKPVLSVLLDEVVDEARKHML